MKAGALATIVRIALGVPAALIWFGLFIVQPVVAIVVLLGLVAWRDRHRRLSSLRPPE